MGGWGRTDYEEEQGSFWKDGNVTNSVTAVMFTQLYTFVNLYCTLVIGEFYLMEIIPQETQKI